MRYENAWELQDEITTIVNVLGFSIWYLRYDRNADIFHLELASHLDEEQQEQLVAHMSLATDYEGEGAHGSIFSMR